MLIPLDVPVGIHIERQQDQEVHGPALGNAPYRVKVDVQLVGVEKTERERLLLALPRNLLQDVPDYRICITWDVRDVVSAI